MKKFRILFMIALVMLTLTVTGCTSDDSIVIYSAMEEERNQALTQQLKKKFPDVDVTVQHVGTGNIAAKLKNEGTSIEADIILDLETSHMENLKKNLADLSSIDSSAHVEGVDTSDKYLAWTKYSVGLIIDNKYFKEHKLAIPKTYEDLLKPQYKGLIAMPDPTSSGSGYAFLLNVVNLKGQDEAIEYFKKLKGNVREFTTSGSGPSNLLKQGEIAIAMGMYSQGSAAITEGYDFSLVELDTGCPYNSTSAGIVSGKEKKEHVKEVFQWLITEFSKYDIENFIPGTLFKDQELKIKNYPSFLKDADMKGIENAKLKNTLSKKWEEVNG